MKGHSRRNSIDGPPRRKRLGRTHHVLALTVAAATGAFMLFGTNDDGANATLSTTDADGESVKRLTLPDASGGATRPLGREPIAALSAEQAPELVTPGESPGDGPSPPKRKTAATDIPSPVMPPVAVDIPPVPKSKVAAQTNAETPADNAQPAPWQTFEVRDGDSLATVFARAELTPRDVYDVVNAGDPANALTRIFPGDELALRMSSDGELQAVRYAISETKTLFVRRGEEGYEPEVITNPLDTRRASTQGTITSSLYGAALGAGLDDRQIMQLAHIFGWDIDFALDLRKGDQFRVVYEELYRNGEKVRNGDILAAEFVNRGERFRAVRFTFPDGDAEYFTPEGKSMRKAFLRTPVNFTRVSSEFNPERLHPVLGYKRPHMGTDYAAPPGTPIKAAGDGKVIHAGRKGGYGNVVIIRHGSRYSTLYGHMKGFRRGISTGDRVKQGEVIGYVGSSGLATGPHLHYEFRIDGKHRNPRTVELPEAEPIPAEYRQAFSQRTSPLLAALDESSGTQLARSDTASDDTSEAER
ncbi:OapA family protein [Arhodomonas sp. AD133]|uniref:OapA family protein n=1 Tax=Arhodomonas sp. AD133 TaxID=3415009 RepID=UPI003EB8E42B